MKGKVTGFLAAAFLLMGLAACGNASDKSNESAPSQNPGDPQKLVNQKCIACHGKNLEGNIGPSLQKIGSKYNESQILRIVEHGKGQMPPGLLEGKNAKAVASWLAKKK